ncbi:hypothetical protein [Burkholderia cenocepacia]|uniref:hypothetical protein n=1 Tax=Burkholderia cenocepacia TaxID=95486 RepID=UPI000F5ACA19|nr:hypothetical protein [Burkholderia cenocepacia]
MLFRVRTVLPDNQVLCSQAAAIDFEEPELNATSVVREYLSQSRPGNAFVGMVSLLSGKIYMHPLEKEPTSSWQTDYEGRFSKLLNVEYPFKHIPRSPMASHNQLYNAAMSVNAARNKPGKNRFIGFSFSDLRSVSPDQREHITTAVTSVSSETIRVSSGQLNIAHKRELKSGYGAWIYNLQEDRSNKASWDWVSRNHHGAAGSHEGRQLDAGVLPNVFARAILDVFQKTAKEEGLVGMASFMSEEKKRPFMQIPVKEEPRFDKLTKDFPGR